MSTAIAERKAQDFTRDISDAMVRIGEKFGLYNAIAEVGPASVNRIAQVTGISRQRISHWLSEQAAAGYLHLDGDGLFHVACPLPESRN